MALKVLDEKGNVYYGSFDSKAGKCIFEKLVSEGKPVPKKDVEPIIGDRLTIFGPPIVHPMLVLSFRDASGTKSYIPVLTVKRFVIPPTIFTITTADGVYKITYITVVFPAVAQWVLTKTRDFEMGVGYLGISPEKQEQDCFSGNILEFSPGVEGYTKVALSCEDIASQRTKPIVAIEKATIIGIDYLL